MSPSESSSLAGETLLDRASVRLADSIRTESRLRRFATTYLPHPETVHDVVERLRWVLFPGFYGPGGLSEHNLAQRLRPIVEELGRSLFALVSGAMRYEGECGYAPADPDGEDADGRAERAVQTLLMGLPQIRSTLSLDVQAAFDGDPAAQHTDEIILCYPGIRALAIHRVAHELYRMNLPLVPRMMAEHSHAVTGIDIHPGARIGRSFFIDHGTGVVIGETTVIGDHCKIYQGVTLGAKSFPKDERGRLQRNVKRHPTLEDHVTVYAGATILGGDTVIGAGSVINGGVFLTTSVPPAHVVRGPKFDITLRSNPELPPGNYAI